MHVLRGLVPRPTKQFVRLMRAPKGWAIHHRHPLPSPEIAQHSVTPWLVASARIGPMDFEHADHPFVPQTPILEQNGIGSAMLMALNR